MENKPSPQTAPLTRPRLYNIVHTYIHKQLPRDIHPAFKALRDREETATLQPPSGLTENPALTLVTEEEEGSQISQPNPKKDDDDNVPLYAVPQRKPHAIIDSVKRGIVQGCCE